MPRKSSPSSTVTCWSAAMQVPAASRIVRFQRGVTVASLSTMAEGEGFEPPVPCGTPVFKTGAFDHSATPPRGTLV